MMTEFADEYIFVSKFFNVICRFPNHSELSDMRYPALWEARHIWRKHSLDNEIKKHHLPISRGKKYIAIKDPAKSPTSSRTFIV